MSGVKRSVPPRVQKAPPAVDPDLDRQLWEKLHRELLARRHQEKPAETFAEIRRKLVRAAKLSR
jgi:hypothetical protein